MIHPYREPNKNPESVKPTRKKKCFFFHSWETVCLTEEYIPKMTFEAFININKWGYKCKDCGYTSTKEDENKMGFETLFKFFIDSKNLYYKYSNERT